MSAAADLHELDGSATAPEPAPRDGQHRSSGGTPAEPAPAASGRPPAPRWHHAARVVLALAVAASVAVAGYAIEASRVAPPALGPGLVTVEVGIEHSRFDLDELRVVEGSLVRFVVRNDDPIDHELVVGDAAVHRRHATGTEQRHPPVPGEVSIAPGETALTFYDFTAPGTVVVACHLPGHAAYGMTAEVEVVPTDA